MVILLRVWRLPTPGDISDALRSQNESAYTLSLGHMGDLTLDSFAYLRGALTAGLCCGRDRYCRTSSPSKAAAVHRACCDDGGIFSGRSASAGYFRPLSFIPASRRCFAASPPGKLVVSDQYYAFSSVFFYADRDAYLLNGRINNLEYGSNAPGASAVFIDNAALSRMWHADERCYLVLEHEYLHDIEKVLGGAHSYTVVKESGGKYLLSNRS